MAILAAMWQTRRFLPFLPFISFQVQASTVKAVERRRPVVVVVVVRREVEGSSSSFSC